MFFFFSKLIWTFLQPTSLIGLFLVISVVSGLLSWRRVSLAAAVIALVPLAIFGWTTAGALVLAPLEAQFSKPGQLPDQVDGIIVLGGAFEGGINRTRGGYELNAAADRMTEGAILALRYPNARLLVTGGSGTIIHERAGDGDTATRFFVQLGIARERLIMEADSRNTDENARFSKDLVQPADGETWILVTSAYHMPRSIGIFRKAGWPVIAWPTDYQTAGDEGVALCRESALRCLKQSNDGIREWVGLLAYWLTGKTDTLFPVP